MPPYLLMDKYDTNCIHLLITPSLQTGAGKSYTMTGSDLAPGIIPLVCVGGQVVSFSRTVVK